MGRQVHFDVDGKDYFVDLLLCADAHERNDRYALSATGSPIAVATYTYETLPPDVRAALPPSDVLASALEATIETSGEQRRVIDLLVAGAHEGGDHLRWDLPNG